MSNHRFLIAAMVLSAGLLSSAGALADSTGIPLTVIDKPNDNGKSVLLVWPRSADSGPELAYEVFMADTEAKPELLKKLDKLVQLKVIDEQRRVELAAELGKHEQDGMFFWSQGRWASEWPKGGRSDMQLCPLKSDMPGSFGFVQSHREGLKRACKCQACQEHALEISKFTRAQLVLRINVLMHEDLVRAVKKAKVAEIQDDDDVTRQHVEIKMSGESMDRGKDYFFQINAIRASNPVGLTPVVVKATSSEWFFWNKTNVLISMFVLSVVIMSASYYAKKYAHKLFIRRIGGLEAVDDALGRAAEMGKPVFFSYGPGDLGSVVNIASINILGKVAEKVAEYGTDLKVTCMNYMVMQVSQEVVRDAYTRAGRPDAYRDDNIFFVSGNTFAYSAAVSAQMIREKAGTAFFFGHFGSESLLLSETGAVTKAIQIAGTDSFNQIPFFITTCDYTLIAEEMYAASAYLSREPRLVGAVKGQDAVKALFMTLIVVGAGLASFGVWAFARWFWALN